MKKRINKLIAYSDHLLTFYLGTVRKYSVLDPMIFSQDVYDQFGSGTAISGYNLIRSTLYYSVVQDIANIFYVKGNKNPCIMAINEMLNDEIIINEIRTRYAKEYIPDEASINFYKQREQSRIIEFNKHLEDLIDSIETIKLNPKLKAIESIRDKFTAHIDLQYDGNGKYEYPDISKSGLKWNTPKNILSELEPIIIRIGFVVRSADFSWDAFEEQNERIASGFWSKKK